MRHGVIRRVSWEDLKSEIISGMVSEACFALCARKLSEGFAEARCSRKLLPKRIIRVIEGSNKATAHLFIQKLPVPHSVQRIDKDEVWALVFGTQLVPRPHDVAKTCARPGLKKMFIVLLCQIVA